MISLCRVVPLAALGCLSACATIVSGTSQRLTVNSVPEGASCRVLQGGMPVGFVAATPGTVQIPKGSAAVQISCAKPGYPVGEASEGAGLDGWVFGNIVIGGLVGIVIDMASGAVYHYHPDMMVALGEPGQPGYPMASGLPRVGYANAGFMAPDFGTGAGFTADQGSRRALADVNERRFEAATGRALPADHGMVLLPPATPEGDPTYIWPRSSND